MTKKILYILLLLFGVFCLVNAIVMANFILTQYSMSTDYLTKQQQDVYFELIRWAIISFCLALPSVFISVKFLLKNKRMKNQIKPF